MKIADQEVTYVDHMGSDLSVVNAARVSFHKVSATFGKSDEKLVAYLARHNHWTPFGHTSISLRIKCPLFVARQLGKHQVGLVWNEVSRRYVDEEPEFYYPEIWRKRAENVKQGSSEEEVVLRHYNPYDSMLLAVRTYESMLFDGCAPEQARMVLPQNMMTEFIWTGSLAAFTRVCKLRLDSHTQKETQEIAKKISSILEPLYPHSYQALMGTTNE